MEVYKFGGASVKDVEAIRNVGEILKLTDQHVLIVISAMGKTTNALEEVVFAIPDKDKVDKKLMEIKDFHNRILKELFNEEDEIFDHVNNIMVEIDWALDDAADKSIDFTYDQVVSLGEMLSTRIVNAYLMKEGISSTWLDVRDVLKTDDNYREAKVDWDSTESNIKDVVPELFKEHQFVITQGFVGVTTENNTTTLGREGSDFTAAIFAYSFDADAVTIWKDVPGMLNADPKWFEETEKLAHISYREAVELAYYGATVIHPKTIKPLQNKKIPLFVRSFLKHEMEGTVINAETHSDKLIPSFIFKMDQVLISITPRDYSFIMEHNLSDIFSEFAKHKVKINLMQNSAINFSVSVDNEWSKLEGLIQELQKDYRVLYNRGGIELITIRHYDDATIDRVMVNKKLFLEQKTRHTARFVVKDLG